MNTLIDMFKVRWSQGAKQESNGVLGIRSAVIRIADSDWKFKKEISRKIRGIQEDLGAQGAVEVELCHGPKVEAIQDLVAGTDGDDDKPDEDDSEPDEDDGGPQEGIMVWSGEKYVFSRARGTQ